MAGVLVVDDSDDVLVIESSGVIIRMAGRPRRSTPTAAIPRGVILMRVEEGNQVIALQSAEQGG